MVGKYRIDAERVNDLEDNLEFLYFLRNEIDAKIKEAGGESVVNEKSSTINDMIQASFNDIAAQLKRGRTDLALDWAESWAKKEWLK